MHRAPLVSAGEGERYQIESTNEVAIAHSDYSCREVRSLCVLSLATNVAPVLPSYQELYVCV